MQLPFGPPVEPMLAQLADAIPEGPAWIYEPKWDGFRTLVFYDGAELYLQSRDSRPLLRYFPELDAPLRRLVPAGAVLDGELVIARGGTLDFEALQLRLHPAASRVAKLSREIPAHFVAFDLLAADGEDLRGRPFGERRARLASLVTGESPLHLTPSTTDPATARDWFARFEGAGLDGVIAKRADGPYTPGKRTMVKVKHTRTADCVVAGFRWFKDQQGKQVGSLLLGLYDEAGGLRPIGVASSFTAKERVALVERLAPYREGADVGHPWRAAGSFVGPGPSRWSAGRDLSWEPLRIALVVEVVWSQLAGDRFRHPAKVVRWRPDKRPEDCDLAQLHVAPAAEIGAIFA